MNIPPHQLLQYLWRRTDIILRGGSTPTRISATDAMALAQKGLIEGKATSSGKVLKFVRWLHAGAIPDPLVPHPQRRDPLDGAESLSSSSSRSTAFARTNMGVYRQPLREAIVAEDIHGRRVVAEGDLVGYCYSFCASKQLDTSTPITNTPAPIPEPAK